MARIEIGKHLAADTRICGARLIFKGSRVLVSDALQLAYAGYTPNAIAQQYRGIITPEAVHEALTLTRRGIVREVVPKTKTAA
jgi:uncharacterized protein (DUF433 family)